MIFKHELFDAWMQPISCISIIDSDNDNVVIDESKFTISKEDINNIKLLLSNKDLYNDFDILFPPVLDGTSHKILINNKKEIECSNLWYWNEDGAFDNLRDDDTEADVNYTKCILNIINTIQSILDKNKIDFYILDDEEDGK